MDARGESTVPEGGEVTIPPTIRDRLDIEPGDRIQWTVDEGTLGVPVMHQREGVFDDFEPVSMGGDGSSGHDSTGDER